MDSSWFLKPFAVWRLASICVGAELVFDLIEAILAGAQLLAQHLHRVLGPLRRAPRVLLDEHLRQPIGHAPRTIRRPVLEEQVEALDAAFDGTRVHADRHRDLDVDPAAQPRHHRLRRFRRIELLLAHHAFEHGGAEQVLLDRALPFGRVE